MGCGQSKIGIIRSRGKGAHKKNAEVDSDEDDSNGPGDNAGRNNGGRDGSDAESELSAEGRRTGSKLRCPLPSGPLIAQTEMSSSQLDFFRMLDEKIENGREYDSDEDRREDVHRRNKLLLEWRSTAVAHSSPAASSTTPPTCTASVRSSATSSSSTSRHAHSRHSSSSSSPSSHHHHSHHNNGSSRGSGVVGSSSRAANGTPSFARASPKLNGLGGSPGADVLAQVVR